MTLLHVDPHWLNFCLCGVSAFLATLFLELWKRHKAKHVSQWKVYDWCEEEVQLFLLFNSFIFPVFSSPVCWVFLSEHPILTLCCRDCYLESLICKVLFFCGCFVKCSSFVHQEELILAIVNDPNCQPKHFRHSYLRSTLVFILITLMVRNVQRPTTHLH